MSGEGLIMFNPFRAILHCERGEIVSQYSIANEVWFWFDLGVENYSVS